MSLPIPNLDDLDFETLVEQARGFIPRYAPDWTDHNIHDPGITLLELAAWLVDQQVYRVGFVSDRHIQAFAALLGVSQQLAEPAQGLIWPNKRVPENRRTSVGANVPSGARVACIEQPEIKFMLDESVYISPARFTSERMAQELPNRFVVTSGTSTQPVAPTLNKVGDKPEEIELIFDRPLIVEDGQDSDNTIYNPIAIGIEMDSEQAETRLEKSPGGYLVADYRFDGDAPIWRRVSIAYDTTAAFNQTGIVLVNIPAVERIANEAQAFSRLRIRAEQRINPLPPRIKRVELNILPIIQAETILQSVMGESNGLPDQSFHINLEHLPQSDIEENTSPAIQVVEDGKFVEWKLVENFSQKGPDTRGFELCKETNKIRFGNGVNGKIPPINAQIRHLNYTLTQGQAGNLQSGLSWTVMGAPQQPSQTSYGINTAPLSGGADAWDMERLIAEARSAALERTSLLTNAELENAAKALEGMAVERANVLVGFHPAQSTCRLKNTRSLIVIPDHAENSDPHESVSQRYYSTIDRMLKSQRVLGERLSILPARRVRIIVLANLLYEDGVEAGQVIQEARQRLQARFSDIQIDNEWDIDPWPLGRDVRCQEVKVLLAEVTGVVAVTHCQLSREGKPFQDEGIALQRHEIAVGGNNDFTINASSIAQERR